MDNREQLLPSGDREIRIQKAENLPFVASINWRLGNDTSVQNKSFLRH